MRTKKGRRILYKKIGQNKMNINFFHLFDWRIRSVGTPRLVPGRLGTNHKDYVVDIEYEHHGFRHKRFYADSAIMSYYKPIAAMNSANDFADNMRKKITCENSK
jgi:hypothetical protein